MTRWFASLDPTAPRTSDSWGRSREGRRLREATWTFLSGSSRDAHCLIKPAIHDLEELLGVEVDVVSEGGLRQSDVAFREDATPL